MKVKPPKKKSRHLPSFLGVYDMQKTQPVQASYEIYKVDKEEVWGKKKWKISIYHGINL